MDGLPPPSAVDIAAAALVVLGTLYGYVRGLSGELAQFVGIAGAFVFGLWLHAPAAGWIDAHTRLAGRSAQTVGFAATAVLAFAAWIVLRALLKPVLRVIVEDRFEKPGGLVAGLVRSVLLVIIVFVVLNLWPHPYLNATFGRKSLIGAVIRSHLPAAPGDEDAP